jgi:BirA family biotin operon repressor/biotin-[acetyl-CoA-carboxylase] ligase
MYNLLTEDIIKVSLNTKIFGRTIYVFNEIDSTNKFARSLALKGAPEGTLVYSEKQIHGRGRWGRYWESPSGKGLWFSLILRPGIESDRATLITLLGVISIVYSIKEHIGIDLKVRWPNDLYYDGKKTAGILAEISGNIKKISFVVLGIGINVNQDLEDFSDKISRHATSLNIINGNPVDRLSLLVNILEKLENDYFRTQKEGFDFVLRRWISKSCVLGKEILLQINNRLIRGVVDSFHTNGDLLLVNSKGQKERFSIGDVIEVKDVNSI